MDGKGPLGTTGKSVGFPYHRGMSIFNPILAIAATSLWLAGPVAAQTAELDDLHERLTTAEPAEAEGLRRQIQSRWSQSGSAAMDLLLRRAEEALQDGDTETAITHFSALIDHAPDFAAGYNGRATAYYGDGRLGLALADLQQVLRLNPRQFNALSGLAIILRRLDRPAESLEVYREVARIAPHIDGLDEAIDQLSIELDGTAL